MGNRLKILLISDNARSDKLIEAINSCGLETDIRIQRDNRGFLSSTDNPDLIMVPFDNRKHATDLLQSVNSIVPRIPVIFIMNDTCNQPALYNELTLSGAFGFTDHERVASVVPYILNIAIDLGLITLPTRLVNPKLLQYIIDSNETMISIINDELKYEAMNESFCRVLGCKREDLVGSCPSKLWGDETFREVIENNLKKSLKGEVVRYKAYFEKSGFTGNCYEVIYRPYQLERGAHRYSIVETRDITELENIKKMVERSDLRNYYLEKYLPFGVFDCDLEGKIIYANDTFYNLLEVPVESRNSLNLDQFFPGDKRFTEYLKSIKEGESSTFSQLQMLTYKGTEMFVRISSHARFDRDAGVVVDAIVEDATREVLLERKLGRTHRMETLGTLAGGIAHDFNTILTTISGYCELAMDEVDPASEIFDYISKVTLAVKRAESVINQMLTFSRQIDLEKIPVKVAEVMKEATDFMRSAIPNNIYLESDVSDPELLVMADPTQLFRVFLNIMTNSVHAMEEKGGLITINLNESVLSERRCADISISDTGSGIDKSIIDRIYEPFFTTKEVGKGSGMGLSVAHGIISDMGGELNVESTAGTGTIFTIRLPLSGPCATANTVIGDSEPSTIVYADENIFFSRTVSLALEKLGYRVLLASTMDDMNLMLQQERPDIGIFFIRCGLNTEGSSEIVQRIIDKQGGARIVLITKPGTTSHQKIAGNDRQKISTIIEPVTLHEILTAINENY